MTKSQRKYFLLSFLCLILVLSGCSTTEPLPSQSTQTPDLVSIHLGWFPGISYAGFYAAAEQGYFADENLDVSLIHLQDFSESAEIPQRVAEGEIDFALGTGVAIPQQQVEGLDITSFATIFRFGSASFFARADSGIVTPADFEGRSVVVKTDIWRQRLEVLLASAGLTLDDVEQIEDGSTEFFLDGRVDIGAGSLANEVVEVRLAGIDIVTFPSGEYGVEAVTGALYTRSAFLSENEDVAVRMLRAIVKGYRWSFDNPAEAVNVMIQEYPDMADNTEFHHASLLAFIPLIDVPGVPIGTIDCEAWLTYAEFGELDSSDNICTTRIMDQVNSREN